MNGLLRGQIVVELLMQRFLVFQSMNIVQPFQTDFGILRLLREADELLYGAVQLPDDVLNGKHGAQSEFPVDNQTGYNKSNQDVFPLIDEESADLLILAQRQAGEVELEQPRLQPFPSPTVGTFGIVELDFLHAVNQLHGGVVFAGRNIETFVIQLPAIFQEYANPKDIQDAADCKDNEDGQIVIQQDNREKNKIDKTEKGVEGSAGEKTFDAVVVADTLDNIARMLAVEKLHGKPKQLCPEAGQQRKVDASADI